MTNEEKQALIERINKHIEWLKKEAFNRYNDHAAVQEEVTIYEIALAALTAQPVKLPKGFSPGIGDIFDKTAPVMRRDASDGKWLHKADVTKILNELGYEVQE